MQRLFRVKENMDHSKVAGVHHRTVRNFPDGTFDLEEMVNHVRSLNDHFPTTTLVCIENSQNTCGGIALPLDWIDQVNPIGCY